MGCQTIPVKRKIKQLTGTFRPDLDVRFVAKPSRTLETFFPTKEPVPKHLQSNRVYTAKCEQCEDTDVDITK
jgi:hypothetical protein